MRGFMFHFALGKIDEASLLVMKYHYSKRPPANIQIVGSWHEDGGLFGDRGDCVAACFFSIPPTRWKEDVLELSRLVRRDDIKQPLTGLIAETCRWIKKRKLADLVVSFADNTQGHHGGIYQASSWNFDGMRDRQNDGLIINGKFCPGRTLNSNYGTRSADKLKSLYPQWEIEKHWDEGKYLYWKAITNSGKKKAERLGLKQMTYPKPQAVIA